MRMCKAHWPKPGRSGICNASTSASSYAAQRISPISSSLPRPAQRQPQHPHDRCRLHGLPPRAGKPWSIPRRTGEGNAETILSAGVPKLQSPGMTFCRAKCIADFAPHDSGSWSCFDERWTLLIGKGKQRHSLLLLLRYGRMPDLPVKGGYGILLFACSAASCRRTGGNNNFLCLCRTVV